MLAPRPTPKLEGHPLSAVRDCLFNLLAATLHIGGHSSITSLWIQPKIHKSYLLGYRSIGQVVCYVMWSLCTVPHGMLTLRPVPLFLTSTWWIQSTLFHFVSLNLYFKIFQSMQRSSQWSVSHRFPHQNPLCTCPLPHMYHRPHSLFHLRYRYFPQHLALCAFSLCSSLQVRDLFHMHWTTHDIPILCILNFTLARWQMTGKRFRTSR